jgi:YVTN family beta-propeller protein
MPSRKYAAPCKRETCSPNREGEKMPDICKAIVVAVFAGAVFLSSTCGLFNKAPSLPVILGPSVGVVGVPVGFRATSTDPEQDSVAFQFDWDDGSELTWTDFVASGGTTAVSHAFPDSSTYGISAKARDKGGNESDWAGAHKLGVVGINRDYPDSLYGDIPVGQGAKRGVVTPDGRNLYVAHEYQDFVTPIRLVDRAVLPTIEVGPSPFCLAAAPNSEHVYVTCSAGSTVAVIRTSDNAVVANVEVGSQPKGIAIASDGEFAYVAVSGENRLAVIQTSNNTVVDSVPLGSAPFDVAADPSGACVYVSLPTSGQVGTVRTAGDTLVDGLSTGLFSKWLGVSPTGDLLYVTNQTDSGLAVVRTSVGDVVAHIRLGDPHLNAVATLPTGDYVLVSDWYGLDYISVRYFAVVDSLPYGAEGGLAVHPSGDTVYAPSNRKVYVLGRR